MHPSLHIALVSMSATVDDDSHAFHVTELAKELGRQGHRVTLYTRRHDDAVRDRTRLGPGASIHYLPAGPNRPLPEPELLGCLREFGTELAKRWRHNKPDVVHAHGWLGGLAACAAAQDTEIPIVQSFHGLGAVERRRSTFAGADSATAHPSRDRLERALGRSADAVLAGCTDEAADLVKIGVTRKKISIVPYAVDGERFRPTGPALPSGERDRLVAVCRDLRFGGLDTAIRALVHLPNAELVIAGGPDRENLENDPVVHRLRVIAKEVHVDDRVIFMGALPRKDVPKLLRSAKVALCLGARQPAPLAPLEAMACGVPVVATPAGGNADTVLDSVTGVHVPADRPVLVGQAVRRMLEESTTLAGYSIAATDRAHSRYSVERIAAENARAYARLLPPPPVPEPAPAAAEATDSAEAEPVEPAEVEELVSA